LYDLDPPLSEIVGHLYDRSSIGWSHLDFGALLRRRRVAAGLTQDALAERSGISAQAISALERGWRRRPHHDTVAMLADGLDLGSSERESFLAIARPACPRGPRRSPATGLPVPATPLVGRRDELAVARKLLSIPHVRLLNVTGPPGVGKTRLAQTIAGDAARGAAVFVDLVRVADAGLVPAAVGRAIGLPEAAPDPTVADLASLLARRRLLLLVDNLEHLLPAAPGLAELLGRCPELRLVATSRAVLHVAGEHELRLRPPPPADAAALFALFVRARCPEFEAAGGAQRAVADICRRLDHLPLALRLAAAWVGRIGLDGLCGRLDLDLLAGGALDAPDHQRTMLGALAWSYALLGPGEQALLRRASVLEDGASLEALQAVTDEADRPLVLAHVAKLIDASLMEARDAPNGPRFGMLGLVREYARRLLVERGEAALRVRSS
jgi:predicted ATPase/DNA-binding XRE family transcriptional regulator